MCFKMGNEIPAIFICLKTQCAFRRQPLFLRANNSTCNQRSWPLLTQRKRKSLIAGFCYHRRGKRSDTFQLAFITSQRIEKKRLHFLHVLLAFQTFYLFITESITTRLFFGELSPFGF